MATSRLCLVRAQNDYAERQMKVSRCDTDTCVIVAAGCRVKRRDNSLQDTMSIIGHERHLYGSVEHIPRMDVPQEGYNSIIRVQVGAEQIGISSFLPYSKLRAEH